MKAWVIFCVLLAGCGDGANYNRGYVISHSQVEPVEEEATPTD